MNTPLPISDIVQVNVSAAVAGVTSKLFNQALIGGSSAVIPSYGANARIRQYPSEAAMLTDGFVDTDPEYIAASLYFGANTTPQFVWIGRQDLTAIKTAAPTATFGGTGYVVGDQVTVTQTGASNGVLTVLTVGTNGVVETLGTTIGNQGTGYSVASGLATTGGSGTGLEVDISAIGETPLQALQACALASGASQGWWAYTWTGALQDSDHLAFGADSSANWQTRLYVGSSSDAGIAAGTTNNLALQMQTLKYRSLLSYDTTQNGLYPNNAYAAAAIVGEACGRNTGSAGSAFTLDLKPIVGVSAEPLTQTQWNAITGASANTVANFGPYDGYLSPGILSSGEFFDQILYRAMLVNLIQTNLMKLLTSTAKVPQTNAGQALLLQQVDLACAQMASLGYLAVGTWEGASISVGSAGIQNGQPLPNGYLNFSPGYSTQSAADRAARKSMPIYCCILEAGAVHSVVIQVNTQL